MLTVGSALAKFEFE